MFIWESSQENEGWEKWAEQKTFIPLGQTRMMKGLGLRAVKRGEMTGKIRVSLASFSCTDSLSQFPVSDYNNPSFLLVHGGYF